jgi:hypothetical protein
MSFARRAIVVSTLGLSFARSSAAHADEPAPTETRPEPREPKSDPRARAQQLFDSALADAEAGNFAAACPKFLASQEADPKTSTLLNLASCYEKNGQTASAWGAFREAEVRARKASRADWESSARKRAEALEAKLFRLSINVSEASRVNGLTVSRDGARLASGEWGVSIPVDPGTHVIEASAEGYKPWEMRIDVREPTFTVDVPQLEHVPEAPLVPPPAPPRPDAPPVRKGWSKLETTGAALAAGGAAAVVVGGLTGLIAKGDYNDARTQCSDGIRGCPAGAVRDSEAAYDTAAGATVVVVVGAVLLVGGIALFAFAPDARVAPPSREGSSSAPSPRASLGPRVAFGPTGIAGVF